MIRQLEGRMFGVGYREEDEVTYSSQAARIEEQERNVRTWSFNEAQDKAARDPILAIIAREEARLAAAEAELETAKKLHEEALGAAPAAGSPAGFELMY